MKYIGFGLLMVFSLSLFYIFIYVLSRSESNLTTIEGKVIKQEKIYHAGYKNDFHAVILTLNNSSTRFAVQDNNERAYDYLLRQTVINKGVTILYDPNGLNSDLDISYHVYELYVGRQNLITMNESKSLYKWGLAMLIVIDIIIVWLFFFWKKTKQVE